MQKSDIELFKFMMKYIKKLYKDEVNKHTSLTMDKIDDSFDDNSFWVGYLVPFTPIRFYMSCQIDFSNKDFLNSILFINFTLETDIDYSNHSDFAAFSYTKNTLEHQIPISLINDIFEKNIKDEEKDIIDKIEDGLQFQFDISRNIMKTILIEINNEVKENPDVSLKDKHEWFADSEWIDPENVMEYSTLTFGELVELRLKLGTEYDSIHIPKNISDIFLF